MSPALWSSIEQRLFPPTDLSTDSNLQELLCDWLVLRQPQMRPGGHRMTAWEATEKRILTCRLCVVIGKFCNTMFLFFFLSFFKKSSRDWNMLCRFQLSVPSFTVGQKGLNAPKWFSIVDTMSLALLQIDPFVDFCDFCLLSVSMVWWSVLTIKRLLIICYLFILYSSVTNNKVLVNYQNRILSYYQWVKSVLCLTLVKK